MLMPSVLKLAYGVHVLRPALLFDVWPSVLQACEELLVQVQIRKHYQQEVLSKVYVMQPKNPEHCNACTFYSEVGSSSQQQPLLAEFQCKDHSECHKKPRNCKHPHQPLGQGYEFSFRLDDSQTRQYSPHSYEHKVHEVHQLDVR